jgi:CHAT domain-containing protein
LILLGTFLLLTSSSLLAQTNDAIDEQITHAKILQRSFKFDESTRQYRKAIELLQAVGENCRIFRLENEIAYNLLDAEKDQEAVVQINRIVEKLEKESGCQDSLLLIDVYITQHQILRDIVSAEAGKLPLDKALQLAMEQSDKLPLAKIYNNYTAYYGSKGANYLALNYAEESMSLKRKILRKEDHSFLAGLFTIANYAERIGDYQRAYLTLDTIIQIAPHAPSFNVADTYHLLSLVCLRRKDFMVAKKYAELATTAYAQQFGTKSRAASFGYQELGSAHIGLGNTSQALENYQKAYDIRKNKYGELNRLTLSSLSSLIQAEMITSDTLASIEKYKTVIGDFIKKYPAENAERFVLSNVEVGDLYRGINQIDSAEKYYRIALNLAEKYYPVGDRVHSQANIGLAKVAAESERKHFSEKALYHLTGDSVLANLNRNTLAFAKDKFAILTVYHTHAQNMFYAYENSDDIKYLKELIDLESCFDLIKDEIFSQFLSIKSIAQSTPIIREISLQRIRASYILYEKSGNKKYLNHALRAIEESKNLILQMQIYEKNLKQILTIPDSLLKTESELYLQINDLDLLLKEAPNDSIQQLKLSLEKGYFDLRRNILLQSQNLDRIKTIDSLDLVSLQKKIPAHSLVLNYFLDQEQLYILAITKQEVNLYKRKFMRSAQDKYGRFMAQLQKHTNNDRAYEWGQMHELYKLLMPPDIDKSITKIVVLPDYNLYLVPFDLLLVKSPDKNPHIGDLSFLIKQYEIAYLSGLGLRHHYRSSNATVTAVAFAPFVPGLAPEFTKVPLLAHSEEEIDLIGGNFETRKFKGQSATEEQFKSLAGKYTLLHIASHAVVNNESPLLSNILFYPPQDSTQEDGKLQLWELYAMDIPADLAVLSACQTSDGSNPSGMGLLNISRGFYTAGTNKVISNMWPVQDMAAQEIMHIFYKDYRRHHNASKALRNAKLEYLKDQAGPLLHPAFWGGWILQQSEFETVTTSYWLNTILPFLLISLAIFLIYLLVRRRS